MSTRKKKTAVSDEAVMEAIRDALEDGVTFRELTAKDSIDAESEAERLMETRNGPVLVASPALRGIALLRRQIAAVGQIEGPLSPRQIGQLSERDLSRLMAAVSLLDSAMAGKLVAERGRPDAVPGSD
ncbi:phage tail assembly protein [Shigella sonnei]|uniref:phage tail assembly protein n=1 Tax=Shigella sonnei TaxID=624 RepID=UPI000662EED8|nr:phage tail assembly protein [Shigella sonnei]CSF50788.1 Mu-like prophage FluMu protein gp41 [Shigella sonnei]CSF84905.1 Mu-like prophage FluMu protein gp41 [Shigella sonnei]